MHRPRRKSDLTEKLLAKWEQEEQERLRAVAECLAHKRLSSCEDCEHKNTCLRRRMNG